MSKDRSPRRRPETTTSPRRTARGVRWRLVLTVIPLLIVAGATYAALRSPYLTVQEIRVEGAATLDPASIADLSNLDGASMLRLPTDSARENLTAVETRVAQLRSELERLQRDRPSRKLRRCATTC